MLVIKELDGSYRRSLEDYLEAYDTKKTNVNENKTVSFGYFLEDKLVGGITAKIEGFHIMYIESLFVLEEYRMHKIGSSLIKKMEEYAKFEGILIIRLDTFSWQAKDFYLKLGYELISSYEIKEGFSEYFFLKRL